MLRFPHSAMLEERGTVTRTAGFRLGFNRSTHQLDQSQTMDTGDGHKDSDQTQGQKDLVHSMYQ
jgi:hypothetical protein